MKNLLLLCFFLLIVCGCSKSEDDVETVIIASEQRMYYVGFGETMVPFYMAKRTDNDKWEYYTSFIEGFDYVPGNEYVIKVRINRIPIEDLLPDQESESYSLLQVLSAEEKQSENLPAEISEH